MRTARYLVASFALVGAITGLAAFWVHVNAHRIHQGRLITILWDHRGVHTIDLVFLGIELVLVGLLVVILLAGFSRR